MIQLESVVSRSAMPHSAEIAGEAVLMDVDSLQYYALNKTGTLVWRYVAEPIGVAELCSQLERDFAGEPEIIRRDVLALLEEMLNAGLVCVVG